MFQSLCSLIRKAKKGSSVLEQAMCSMTYHVYEETYADMDEMCEPMRHHVHRCIDRMIWIEQRVVGLNYFVFYRVVDDKYTLYQFNTLILEAAGLYAGKGLLVTPSVNDCDFPDSMETLMGLFKTKCIRSDLDDQCLSSVVSVNCTLFPSGNNHIVYDGHHICEANPIRFFVGYDGTPGYWQHNIRKVLTTNMSEASASGICLKMESLYQKHSNGYGNCLQICVPASALHQFVYPCVHYGKPVTVHGTAGAYKVHDKFPSHPVNTVSYEEFLFSAEARHTQARIIAHPNLFLKHGAVVNVMNGNPEFDADGFREGMLEIMQPFLAKSSISCTLNKFG